MGLDGVRGLAILLVMAIHFVGDATPHSTLERAVVKAAGYGLLGVDLFFVLSGFLITGLLLEARGEAGYFQNFYARRTLRIFPLYYFVLGVLFVVLPRLTTPSSLLETAREHQVWLWTYTSNFYLAKTSSWASLSYVSHFWSLSIEEHFYLLWPMLVAWCEPRMLERVCVGAIVGAVLLRLVLTAAGVSELSISVLTPCRLDTLSTGALLALLARRGDDWRTQLVESSGRWVLLLGAVIVVLSGFGVVTRLWLPALHQIRGTLFALFFGAMTLTSLQPVTRFWGRVFASRTLRFFGKYSYGLYVYHGLFTWLLIDLQADQRLEAWLGSPRLVLIARAVLGTSCSVLVAVCSYELFEKRFLALKRYFAGPDQPILGVAEPTGLTTPPARTQ